MGFQKKNTSLVPYENQQVSTINAPRGSKKQKTAVESIVWFIESYLSIIVYDKL